MHFLFEYIWKYITEHPNCNKYIAGATESSYVQSGRTSPRKGKVCIAKTKEKVEIEPMSAGIIESVVLVIR